MRDENKVKFQIHCGLTPNRESCGLLVVKNGKEILILTENVAEKDNHFEIRAKEILDAKRTGDIIGVVHSHISDDPYPSKIDLASCENWGVQWHIYSVGSARWHSFSPSGNRVPLLGREYSHGILDCYTLVRDWYNENYKLELPNFHRDWNWWLNGKNLYLDNLESCGFEIIDEPLKLGDAILFKISSPVYNHAAIYIGNEMILHHAIGRLSCRELYSGFWRMIPQVRVRHVAKN